MSSSSSELDIPQGQRGPAIPGMTGGVHIGVPFISTVLSELDKLGASKVFVLANNSSRPLVQPLIEALQEKEILAAPLSTDIVMGGSENGILKAAGTAAEAKADCIVTVGGGAIQDAGKLIRLWLAAYDNTSASTKATADGIRAVTSLDPMPTLPPQICCPNSFAMAELTSVAGMTLENGVKSGAAHASLIPTVTIFDPSLTSGLPDWVRFGTALRCVEHAVGSATHPRATDEIRNLALQGLKMVRSGLDVMVANPTSTEAALDVYTGGWCAVRALNTNGCYPALGHLIENMYSAKYGVHQGSCSGILCGRILAHHYEGSKEHQDRIAAVLAESSGKDNDEVSKKSAAYLVKELVSMLPGVAQDHSDAGVDVETLRDFVDKLPIERFNKLSPTPFKDLDDVYNMLTRPLDQL